MTKEEKIKEAKRLYKTANADQRYVLESLFPELKELGDERVRKELIDYINRLTVTPNNIDRYNAWIAWLEKQALKPKWSEEDSKMIETLIAIFEVNYPDGFYKVNPIGTIDMQGIHSIGIIKWLRSIKQRMEEEI